MRTACLGLIIAAGLTAATQAQEATPPAPTPPEAAAAAPETAPSAVPATPEAQAPQAQTPEAQTPEAQTPEAQTPEAAPPAALPPEVAPPPTLPTTGDGAVVLNVLEKICVPLVRGGALDQLAPSLGMRKNRREGTWSMRLGDNKNYTITVLPQGVNRDVCQAEVHFAIGQEDPIVTAINVWSFLHKPKLVLQANYVAVDADGVKRVRKSWEHLESNSSTAVNFTTWRKPDDSPLNRNYDTGYLFYQERTF